MPEEMQQPEELQPEPERVSSPERGFTPPRPLQKGEKWTVEEAIAWLDTQTWQSETDSTAFIRRMRDASRPGRPREDCKPEERQPEPERVSSPEQKSSPPWSQNGEQWTVEESIAWLETQTWETSDSTAFIRRMRDASRPGRPRS